MAHHFFLAGILNFFFGMALGALGGMLGIGGGLIAIPMLAFVYGMDQHLAQGTALVMIIPNVLIGFIRYRQRNHIDLRATVRLALSAVVSSYIAARYAALLDAATLRIGFAMFLLALAAYFTWQLRAPALAPAAPLPARLVPVVGLLSGVMSGLFTVGGGLIVVPALVTFFRASQTQAQGIALALVLPGALVALLAYAQAGHVSWMTGLPLAAGGIVSVSWGVALAHSMPPARLRMLFCVVLAATALMMLVQR